MGQTSNDEKRGKCNAKSPLLVISSSLSLHSALIKRGVKDPPLAFVLAGHATARGAATSFFT